MTTVAAAKGATPSAKALLGPDEDGEPGEAEGEDDGVAERHRGQKQRPRTVPAALGENADQRRRDEEAGEIAAGRARHIGRPGERAGEHRQAEKTFGEIERDRRRASRAPKAAPSASTTSVCRVIGTG